MEGTIGEVRMFGGNFAPRTWARCDGQLMAISSNTALFSILGTIYGGDGRTTFALPDVRGRLVIGPGNGPGLSSWREGQRLGQEHNTMNIGEMPSHNHSHAVKASSTSNGNSPDQKLYATASGRATTSPPETVNIKMYGDVIDSQMGSEMVQVGAAGGQQSINNMMPYQAVYYIICLQGLFPSRS